MYKCRYTAKQKSGGNPMAVETGNPPKNKTKTKTKNSNKKQNKIK